MEILLHDSIFQELITISTCCWIWRRWNWGKPYIMELCGLWNKYQGKSFISPGPHIIFCYKYPILGCYDKIQAVFYNYVGTTWCCIILLFISNSLVGFYIFHVALRFEGDEWNRKAIAYRSLKKSYETFHISLHIHSSRAH